MGTLQAQLESRRTFIPPPAAWNTRDAPDQQSAGDAVVLDNLIKTESGLEVRPGYDQFFDLGNLAGFDALGGTTLYNFHFGQYESLIAFTRIDRSGIPGYLAEITATVPGQIDASNAFIAPRFAQQGDLLGVANGYDMNHKIQWGLLNNDFFGAKVAQLITSAVDGDGNEILIPPVKTIHTFKSRSYFTADEQAFYYSAVDAFGGSITKFPIDRVSSTGGVAIDTTSWTVDGGSGPDDFFVILLNSGEIIVYQGSDPSSDFSLVGKYELGAPVVAHERFGGKLHVIASDYNIIPDDLLTKGIRTPSKLSGVARQRAKEKGSLEGWQILTSPQIGWRIINVPTGVNQFEQHVINLYTGGVSRFDYPARSFAVHKGELYFGGLNGIIYKVTGTTDTGSKIPFALQTPFSDLGSAYQKTIESYRPIWDVQGDISYSTGLAFDYRKKEFSQNHSEGPDEGSPWDTSEWDTSDWTVGSEDTDQWVLGGGEGRTVSFLMDGQSSSGGIFRGVEAEVR